MRKKKPNFLVILIDDLRYDEFGAGGHPYMKTLFTPHPFARRTGPRLCRVNTPVGMG